MLQYRYPYLDPYAKQIKAQSHVAACASCYKTGKLAKKSWQIVVIRQIRQSFFPSKVFHCTVLCIKYICYHK